MHCVCSALRNSTCSCSIVPPVNANVDSHSPVIGCGPDCSNRWSSRLLSLSIHFAPLHASCYILADNQSVNAALPPVRLVDCVPIKACKCVVDCLHAAHFAGDVAAFAQKQKYAKVETRYVPEERVYGLVRPPAAHTHSKLIDLFGLSIDHTRRSDSRLIHIRVSGRGLQH